jgi:hypothetical protein
MACPHEICNMAWVVVMPCILDLARELSRHFVTSFKNGSVFVRHNTANKAILACVDQHLTHPRHHARAFLSFHDDKHQQKHKKGVIMTTRGKKKLSKNGFG